MSTTKTTTTVTKSKPSNKTKRTVVRRRRRKGGRIAAINRRKMRRAMRLRVPVATRKTFRKIFNITSQDGNSMTVRGRDLVYAIPDNLTSTIDSQVITIIPANPCYWLGTRIAALAAGYQNYRPLKFKVTYVPECAVTQQGNVIGGTLWHTLPARNNLQQTLRTSPGGMLTQCYNSRVANVKMKSNLQVNLFRCSGKFDQQSNPFIYVAISVACYDTNNNRIIPGWFYIDYVYTFKNPIGLSHTFYNSGLTTVDKTNDLQENMSLIICQNDEERNLTIGQLIQLDYINGKYIKTYNDTELDLSKDIAIWKFASSSIGFKEKEEEEEEEEESEVINTIYYNTVYSERIEINNLNSFAAHTTTYFVADDKPRFIVINPTGSPLGIPSSGKPTDWEGYFRVLVLGPDHTDLTYRVSDLFVECNFETYAYSNSLSTIKIGNVPKHVSFDFIQK